MSVGDVAHDLQGVAFKRLPTGTSIARGVVIGEGTYVGASVTLYPGVTVGEGCVLLDGAVIGRLPIATATTTRPVASEFGRVEIGDGSIVGANAVIYTNTRFGRDVLIG